MGSAPPIVDDANELAAAVVAVSSGAAAGTSPAKAAASKPKYFASIYPDNKELPVQFGEAITELQHLIKCRVWMIIQGNSGAFSELDDSVYAGFFKARSDIELCADGAALLLESSGGQAESAFKIARLFQRRVERLCIVVPKYAKSAATLLALAASDLMIGEDAELGPLDVQMFDFEREEYGSALNAVQSLERINAFSMTVIDQMTPLLMSRTGRKLDTLLPHVMNYAVSLVKPLLDKVDTVDFTKKSRELKVAEEYAIRLLRPNYPIATARRIAENLVSKFPTHGFVIDREEAMTFEPAGTTSFGLGIKVQEPPADIQKCLDRIIPFLDELTVIGHIVEKSK